MQLSRTVDDMTGGQVVNQAKLPKFLRLSNAFLNRIEAGDVRPGVKLPLEGMLAGALAMYLATTGSLGMVWEIFGRTYRRQPASY